MDRMTDDKEGTPSARRFKAWFARDRSHSARWREEAREDYEFKAGRQWSKEEEAALEDAQRPIVVFNRCLAILKAVAGSEINSRQEIRYIGRTMDDAKVNEVLTGASKYFADESDAEDEESEAFQDGMICGMGWTEQRIDFEVDPEGCYVEDRIDPLEMYWDHAARKKNLVDARRVWRVKRVSLGEAREQFPGFSDSEMNATWAARDDLTDDGKTPEQKRRRMDTDQDEADPWDDSHEVTIVECQWWEKEPYHVVADPMTGARVEMDAATFAKLSGRMRRIGVKLTSARLTRRVYKRVFIGAELLTEPEMVPTGQAFSYQCMTGERDDNRGTFFGLLRTMRDPQKWANKWLSQTLHIMNASAKGGIMAEADAFEDQRQAEATWARPEAITWLRKGALSTDRPKIQPKPAATFPAGFYQIMEFAISSIMDVTGINLELLGMRDANQPGILEAQRKQAAMTILATMFDSLRRLRKLIGRNRLHLIQTTLSDGRLARIVGENGPRMEALTRDKTVGKYDVIVDDAPASPNQKEANWAIISQMLPAFQAMMTPEVALLVLEYSPLPVDFVERLKGIISSGDQDPQQAQQAMVMLLAALAKVQRDQAAAQKDKATAEQTQVETARLMQTPIALPGF